MAVAEEQNSSAKKARSSDERILVLDFGSQYAQLIARRVREQKVYCEIVRHDITPAQIRNHHPIGLILSGGPNSVYEQGAPRCDPGIFEMGIPVLGICYGMQLACEHLGGKVESTHTREYGRAICEVASEDEFFKDFPAQAEVWMSHGDQVQHVSDDFMSLARTDTCPVAAVKHRRLPVYGLQFHPEVTHTPEGATLLKNFLFEVCGSTGTWKLADFANEAVERIRKQVGDNRVICGLSGGVDSSVVAALLYKAIGPQLSCILVDNGLLRQGEADSVVEEFSNHFKTDLHVVDGKDQFLAALASVNEPEEKRKRIGHVFIECFKSEADKIKDAKFLAQGTLYPDVIESGAADDGPAATIKLHHNVGGLPEELGFELIEPLRDLFKDEVRRLGLELGLPDVLVWRHPFPGPGLAVRCLGEITEEKLKVLREADAIVIEEIRSADLYRKTSQLFAVLLPVQSVGVMGDARTYENALVIRCVNSDDFMTADWTRLPYEVLAKMSTRIINEVAGVNRVCYDISSKPPATIEWEYDGQEWPSYILADSRTNMSTHCDYHDLLKSHWFINEGLAQIKLMSKQYIFQMVEMTKKHGTKTILNDIWLSFYPGAKIGVLGRNGSGKSTLLKIMAGIDREIEGEARLTDGFTVGYLPQEPLLNAEKNVWDNVQESVAPRRELLDRYNELSAKCGEPLEEAAMQKVYDEMARVQDQIDATNTWSLDHEIEVAFEVMNLPPKDADVTKLSGGEKRRVALCKLLLEKPDLLLLDEPTNHLDADSVNWLERTLQDYHGTIVAVTHDRYFLDNVAGWILELDRGEGHPFEGNYSSWLEQKQARLKVEEKQNDARIKALKREAEWIKMSPKARQSKSKARISSYEQMLNEEQRGREDELEIQIPPGPHLGDVVIEAENLTKGFGDNILMEDVNFRLPPGGIVGIIGPNGAGKTTLFRMITGDEQPDSGKLNVGSTVQLGYVDQSRESLNDNNTVYQEISEGHETLEIGKRKVNARAYVNRFNFRGPDQEKKVGVLSGGERNRVHLSKLLRRGSNVLLLDEPTNDLDVDTLRALEEAILNYAGCVVVTSHDRWFLDRIATHILAFEGDGYVHWCEGNYQTYELQRRERLGLKEDEPRRFRYKKLIS